MAPLSRLAAASMVAVSTTTTTTTTHRSAAPPHRLFAPGRKSPSRDRQFALIPSLLRSLPLPPNSSPPPGLPAPAPHPNPSRKLKPTHAAVLSYDGSAFPGGYEHNRKLDAPTVGGVLTERISAVLGLEQDGIRLSTAGRTDALVSAKATMITFFTREDLPDTFVQDVNAMRVDDDVVVHSVTPVHASFHAAFNTVAREYIYVLPLLPDGMVFENEEGEGIGGGKILYECTVDNAMRLARTADVLLSDVVGTELDYVGMSSGRVQTQTTLCTIRSAGCWHYDREGRLLSVGGGGGNRRDDVGDVVPGFGDCWREACQLHDNGGDRFGWSGCFVFKVKSDRFLRRMMRKLVDSVLQEASSVLQGGNPRGEMDVDQWKGRWRRRVESKDRSGNIPAPPQGLCLWYVDVQ